MSKYYITINLDHRECYNEEAKHICPMATRLQAGIFCSAINGMGRKEDLMHKCPIKESLEIPSFMKKETRGYHRCPDCKTTCHTHLEECPECGTKIERS